MAYEFGYKMNPEVKKLWVAALRSGEYKQGTQWLRRGINGKTLFCCLGVLCNLHAQAHPEIAARQLNPDAYMDELQALPYAVVEWAGLRRNDPHVLYDKLAAVASISYLNDAERWSFKKLADAIEEQF